MLESKHRCDGPTALITALAFPVRARYNVAGHGANSPAWISAGAVSRATRFRLQASGPVASLGVYHARASSSQRILAPRFRGDKLCGNNARGSARMTSRGGAEGDRTPDLRADSAALSQ